MLLASRFELFTLKFKKDEWRENEEDGRNSARINAGEIFSEEEQWYVSLVDRERAFLRIRDRTECCNDRLRQAGKTEKATMVS